MLPRPSRRAAAVVGAAALTIALATACTSADASSDGRLSVVTSTDVYGDLVRTVGGDRVDVTSFITGASQDPHSFEASARDELALTRADVIVENGGGYDDFMDTLRDGTDSGATVLNAVSISGRTAPPGGELNEHVWYDLPAMVTLTDRLVAALSAADRSGADGFAARGRTLVAQLHALEQTERTIRTQHAGEGVAITEPVPLWMLQACGLVDRTPEQFSEAVEAGSGVPASALSDTLDLFDHHDVRALVYNEQTSGPETDEVLDAARSAGIPTVGVTETLPAGDTYVSWMRDNLAALEQALR